MKANKNKTALFIGRFQPFHNGHLFILRNILKDYKMVKIVIGSAQEDYTLKNPLTAGERKEMFDRLFRQLGIKKDQCRVYAASDISTNSEWVAYIAKKVGSFDAVVTASPLTKILFEDSAYKVEEHPLLMRKNYSGTEIRRRVIKMKRWDDLVPTSIFVYLQKLDISRRLKEISRSDNPYV